MKLNQRGWDGGRKERCLRKAEGGLRERRDKQGSGVSSSALTKQQTTSALKRTHQDTLRSQRDAWTTRLRCASPSLSGCVDAAGCRCAWRTLLLGLKCQRIDEGGWKRCTGVCMVKLDRRWRREGARREAARRAEGESKESGRKQRARSEEARGREALACLRELPSLEEHAGTVAEQAQTRRTKHEDVSARHRHCMR